MEYTREDVVEMQELLRENYLRCLAFEHEEDAEVDNIQYTVQDDKIIANKCVQDANEVVISDIFDMVSSEIFYYSPFLSKLTWEKEELDTSLLRNSWSSGFTGREVVAVDCYKIMNGNYIKHRGNSTVVSVALRNCKVIGSYSFANFMALTDIDLSGVEEIGDGAFKHCDKITSLDASSVTKLGRGVFKYMSGLESIDLTNADILRTDTFRGCSNLKVVKISNKCKKIEKNAFNGLTQLKHIQFEGTKEEWQKLSKNMDTWRGETFAEFKNNKFTASFIK